MPDRAAGQPFHDRGRSSTAELVTSAWCDILGLPTIEASVGFFDLGASSADIALVTARLRATWPNLQAVDLFLNPTVESLIAFLEQQPREVDG